MPDQSADAIRAAVRSAAAQAGIDEADAPQVGHGRFAGPMAHKYLDPFADSFAALIEKYGPEAGKKLLSLFADALPW